MFWDGYVWQEQVLRVSWPVEVKINYCRGEVGVGLRKCWL